MRLTPDRVRFPDWTDTTTDFPRCREESSKVPRLVNFFAFAATKSAIEFGPTVCQVWRMYDKSSYQLSLKRFMRKYFIFMYLFYPPSIKIVFPENTKPSWLIPKTGQLGFSQWLVLWRTPSSFFCYAPTLALSLSLSLSLFACFPFFPFQYKYSASVPFRLLMFEK
jgi:hypothetical protein